MTSSTTALGATLRAKRVMAETGFGGMAELRRAADTVNEVWFTGALVLRVTPNRSSHRLHHEAQVAELLPPEVGYPDVVATGRSEAGEWMLTRRIDGKMLSQAWPDMDDGQRATAVEQLAGVLRAVHTVVPPPSFAPPFLAPGSLECPHQLPAGRILDLLDRARSIGGIPATVLDKAEGVVREGMGALDPPDVRHGLIHGDLHFGNLLWDGQRISAVLDFEWSRGGPPDLDLDVLLRFLSDPAAHVDKADRSRITRSSVAEVPAQLRAAYPELFAHPRLADRLRLYALSYDLRELLLDPPRHGFSQLHPDHPFSRIRRLLDGRDHLLLL